MLRFFVFRSPDAKDMRRSVTTRTRDTSMLLTTPRATSRPLIQVPPYLGLCVCCAEFGLGVSSLLTLSHNIVDTDPH
jgi:hypothetical protein